MSNIVLSGKLILENIGIDLSSSKYLRPLKRTHYKAVINWLIREYKLSRNASNLDKEHCLSESFHHLYKAEPWKEASEIIFVLLKTPMSEALHNQLASWGYYPLGRYILLNQLDLLSTSY